MKFGIGFALGMIVCNSLMIDARPAIDRQYRPVEVYSPRYETPSRLDGHHWVTAIEGVHNCNGFTDAGSSCSINTTEGWLTQMGNGVCEFASSRKACGAACGSPVRFQCADMYK